VPRDPVEAAIWLWRAARLGRDGAQEAYDRLAEQMTAEEIVEAEGRAKAASITNPEIIRATLRPPIYPELARVARLEASVILEAVIRADGTIGEIELLRCSRPHMGFEESAVEAVGQWRYEPARMADGTPVDVYFTIVVDFELL
jgi:protein TonB